MRQNGGHRRLQSSNQSLWSLPLSFFAHGSFQLGVRRPHHLTYDTFLQAVEMECELCREIEFYPGETEYEWRKNHLNEGPPFHLKILRRDGQTESFELHELQSSPVALSLAKRSLSATYTGHELVLNLAEYWFQDCVRNHGASCVGSPQQSWYPTRLLDISTGLVRLVAPDFTVTNQPYATISYCWGEEAFFRTTSSTLEQIRAGVLEEHFPQLFQDLIKVARRLRIQYLWIDCYCIIQPNEDAALLQLDSLSDWQREAGNIEKVYENSIINFGAAHATSPLQNCFRSREEQPRMVSMIDWQPRQSDRESTYLLFSTSLLAEHVRGLFENPLFSRGWVFQERLLCRRMLHFTGDQIHWECSAHESAELKDRSFKCETSPVEIRTKTFYDFERYPWSIDNQWRDGREVPHWISIATAYSQLDLTYPDKDKFFALNGIAKRAASLQDPDDVYAAGMFRSSLLPHLLWFTFIDRVIRPGRRSTTWRAPSWSWLSVDGDAPCKVFHQYAPIIELGRVIDVRIELCDISNPFGPLQSALLTLCCRSLISTIIEGKLVNPTGQAEYPLWFYADDKQELDAIQGEVVIAPIILRCHDYWADVEGLPQSAISKADLQSLGDKLKNFQTNLHKISWLSLVLRKTEAGSYKRVGYVSMEEDRYGNSRSEILDLLIETEANDLILI